MAELLNALTGTAMMVWVPALAGYACVCAFGYLTRGEDLVELRATPGQTRQVYRSQTSCLR
jgi:hypothetical protein